MPILCYHAVDPTWRSPLAITPDRLARDCAWLRQHRRVVGLGQAIDRMNGSARLPGGLTVLTFDDGFAGLHRYALPILRQHGLPATVFLVAETLTDAGRSVDWVDDPPPYPPPEGEGTTAHHSPEGEATTAHPLATLTRSQVLEMQDAGITFGSHSYAHRDLTTLSEAECERDLRASREVLEDLLGRPVPWLAYPRGRHNERVRQAAARARFTHAFSLPEGPEPIGTHAVPRTGIWPKDGIRTLRIKTSDWYLGLRTSPAYRFASQARPARLKRIA